ncbi:hypothetical protein RDABS01_021729 [Bienertia sinuspersici]
MMDTGLNLNYTVALISGEESEQLNTFQKVRIGSADFANLLLSVLKPKPNLIIHNQPYRTVEGVCLQFIIP